MKIMIVGCGRVGSALAALLSGEGHEVTIMDVNARAFKRLPSLFLGTAIVGNGIDEEALQRAGIASANLFVAVTEGDNRNVMSVQIAKHIFGVPRVICRIYDPVRSQIYRDLGLETISSTQVMTHLLHKAIEGTHSETLKEQ